MTVTGVVITWILCGLIAGAIGASRNVGFLLHALIGFLFGPVGIITAVLFKPTDEDAFKNRGEASGLVKCPYCAELVKAEAKICKHCRSDLLSRSNDSKPASVDTEIYRLHQIQIFSDHCEVEDKKFNDISEAKAWIDSK